MNTALEPGIGPESALVAELRRERGARELRLEIQRMVAQTSGSTTRHGVARAIADNAADIVEAGWAFLGFVGDDDMVSFVFGPNMPTEVANDWKQAPLDVEIPATGILRGELGDTYQIRDLVEMEQWPLLLPETERANFESLLAIRVGEPNEHGRAPAVLSFGWPTAHSVDRTELLLIEELALAAAPAFQRAQRTEIDSAVANTLQNWMRPPRADDIDGFHVEACYAPGRDEMLIGGDWYDVVRMDDTRTAIVIGDVVGHDVRAAAEMGQVRHVLASHLMDSADVAGALGVTDRYFADRAANTMATVLVIAVDRSTDEIEVGAAGHLPPLAVSVDGSCELVPFGLGPPIGSGLGVFTTEASIAPAGTAIVGFTDGLVERRGEAIDQSLVLFQADVARLSADPAVSDAEGLMASLHGHISGLAERADRVDDAAAIIVCRKEH